jgi:Tol biopolymer transport system component
LALAPGTRLGVFEIAAQIGEGGMGAVYRATDTSLNRQVAIKVLPDAFAADADRLARFEREAKTLASLNHPHIAAIYAIEKSAGATALVMELVEGDDLSQRIARGAIPIDEALPIAKQIAEALEAAHEQGIIHRDLKPANIKVRSDGTVKVLDFGLAKAMDVGAGTAGKAGLSMSPTLTSPVMTQAGIVLGTAPYMSPEQAKGRPVDRRTDVWAFGAVLFEMLAGTRAFPGEDVTDTIVAVMSKEPDFTTLPSTVPARVVQALRVCLRKDAKQRVGDIRDVRLALEGAFETVAPQTIGMVTSRAPAWTNRLPWAITGAIALVAALTAFGWWRSARPVEPLRPLVRLDVDLGAEVRLGSPSGTDVIISRDGTRLAFLSQGRLFTRRLDQPKVVELADTQGAKAPFFSPDGRWIGFFVPGQLKKVAVDGGAAVFLCAASGAQGGAGSWGEDGTIVGSLDGSTLSRVSDSGGTPSRLTELADGEVVHRWPQVLPGGQAVLLSVQVAGRRIDEGRIDVLSLRDGRRKTIQRGGMFGRYLATPNGRGYLVYVAKGTVFGAPFDLGRFEVVGTPAAILEEVGYNINNGTVQMDASQTGTLVYRSVSSSGLVTLQWLDAAGKTDVLPAKPAAYLQPAVSPDGKYIASTIFGLESQDIWIYDWQRDAMSRLTFGGRSFQFPVWHPSGRYISFGDGYGGRGLFWTRSDGVSTPQVLTERQGGQFPWSFSPDGKRLAFADFASGQGDIWTVPVEDTGDALKAGKPEVFLQTPANELYPAFSPDGRWLAYRSNESGTDEVYVRAFPDKGGKWLISNGGGVMADWSPNGRELFYRTLDQRIMVVTYSGSGDVFIADKPRLWTETRLADTVLSGRNLDIAPDSKRFLALMPAGADDDQRAQSHVIFLQNFADEIGRRLAAQE